VKDTFDFAALAVMLKEARIHAKEHAMHRISGLAVAAAVALTAVLAVACREAQHEPTRLETASADPKAYARQVDDECDHGRVASCTSVGLQMAFGTFGRTKDEKGAVPFLDKACLGGDGQGCHELAVMFENGRGVARDPARAKELHEKACAAGAKASCP
jgi:TPR repeat protein